MVFFFTDTGLKLLGAVGPVCWIGSSNDLQPAKIGVIRRGVPTAAPMAKSVSFL